MSVAHCMNANAAVSKISFSFLFLGGQNCIGTVDTLKFIGLDHEGQLKGNYKCLTSPDKGY